MPMSSATVICTFSTYRRFQIGSNIPLANRNARMFWTVFAQIMVDPEDLGLVEYLMESPVELLCALQVTAERFLYDDLGIPVQVALSEPLDDQWIGRGRRGAVVEPAAVRPFVPIDLFEVLSKMVHGHLAVELSRDVGEARLELGPLLPRQLASTELLDRGARALLEFLVLHLAPGVPDDGEPLREEPFHEEVIEGGEQLAFGEVAGRAEDDDRLGLRRLDHHLARVLMLGVLLDGVATELLPESRDHLRGIGLVLTRGEPAEQGKRCDRSGDVLVHGSLHRPPPLARVLDVPLHPGQVGVTLERVDQQFEQP